MLSAQIELKSQNTEEDSIILIGQIDDNWTVNSSKEALLQLASLRQTLQINGYFDTDYQLSTIDSTHANYSVRPGVKYVWNNFRLSNQLSSLYLRGTGIHDVVKNNQAFHYASITTSIQLIINNLANDGYPFATLKMDSIQIENNTISAFLDCNKGTRYYIQDIKVNGTSKISKSYLKHYLGLKKGKVYSQKTILSISQKLNEIPFLKQSGTPGVRFYKESAQIYVHLDDQASDQFDILLGFQPNPPGSAKSFNLIGKAFISLHNNLHYGEKFSLNYNGQGETKELLLHTIVPYILDTRFGIEGNFSLYSKDLEYLRLAYKLGLQYALGGENYISTFWRHQQSNLLNIDVESIKRNKVLPNDLDYKINDIGFALHLQELDYKFNPTKGWVLDISLAGGNKSIQQNSTIPELEEVNIDSLYNAIAAPSARGEVQITTSVFWPLGRRNTIKTSITTSGLFSNAVILNNENYRIGGTRLLRGFNEDQFQSSLYAVGSIEYRFLISQNGFLSAFSDIGYIKSKNTKKTEINPNPIPDLWPLSLGLGFSFETTLGIFQLNYAVGKTQLTPWDVSNGKIHFGYLSIF